MIKTDVKIDTNQTMEIGECPIEVALSTLKKYRGRSQYNENYRSDFRR